MSHNFKRHIILPRQQPFIAKYMTTSQETLLELCTGWNVYLANLPNTTRFERHRKCRVDPHCSVAPL